MKLTGKDWGFIALAAVFAVVCARLGIWQLDRLHQRRALNAAVTARRALPPLEVTGAAISVDSVRDRPVGAHGVYDYARQWVWPGRSFEGVPGVAVVTPLKLSDSLAVMVDRGWVPSPDGFHVSLIPYEETSDTVEVTGLGAKLPRGRGDYDPSQKGEFPYRVLPMAIQLLPPGPQGAPRRWPEVELGNGPHLGYAIQWFSFATIAVMGTAVFLRRR